MSHLSDCVLIVEDEFFIADYFAEEIRAMGHAVCGIAESADEALEMARAHRPSLILMDVRLKGERDGIDASIAIHAAVGSKVIFITGSREPANVARIAQDHPAAVLFKPLRGHQLRSTVESVRLQDGFGIGTAPQH
ncbi:MAG TPA: response regulator [Rhodopseudomonas sp.]|uniref:response regulator n=1 Tax=Rhodopseudomonas sp. TaxID=1078 RepID=UPI002EDACF9F